MAAGGPEDAGNRQAEERLEYKPAERRMAIWTLAPDTWRRGSHAAATHPGRIIAGIFDER
jgi:hypothetical protein